MERQRQLHHLGQTQGDDQFMKRVFFLQLAFEV
jgi:hypothetical protein